MARKRAAILDAARDTFLRLGYEGASMEAIAAQAGVSIMTLYRHAAGKDNLFAAVVAGVCHPAEPAERERIEESLQKSLADILIFLALMFQERVAGPTTTALFRAVMVESGRHPQLARMAYDGLIGAHVDALAGFLANRVEARSCDSARVRDLATRFLDGLVGLDSFAVLLGFDGISAAERQRRAEAAATQLLHQLEAAPAAIASPRVEP